MIAPRQPQTQAQQMPQQSAADVHPPSPLLFRKIINY